MALINFNNRGFTGPSFFADAGPEQDLIIPTLDNGNLINVEIIGGVVLGKESNLSVEDPVVYGTADFGDHLSNAITIDIDRPISDFSVTLFNGRTVSITYKIVDNKGDSVTVTLGPNSSPDSAQKVVLPDTHGATRVDIFPVDVAASGPWDFSIDNIGFDFSVADTKIPKNPEVAIATVKLVFDLISLSVAGNLLAPSGLSDALLSLQIAGLWGNCPGRC